MIVIAVPIIAVMMFASTAFFHHVVHRTVITATEPFAIFPAHAAIDMRVAIFFPVAHVGLAVVIKISAGAFNAVMKTLPLCVAELLRGCVPLTVALIASLLISGRRRALLCEHLCRTYTG